MNRTLRYFYSYIVRYPHAVVVSAIVVVIATVLSELSPFFYRIFIDSLSNEKVVSLLPILILFVAVKVVATVLFEFFYVFTDYYFIRAARDARLTIFKKLHDLDFIFHSGKRAGTLISIMKRGDSAFFSFHHELNTKFPRLFIRFVFISLILLSVGPKYGLVLLILVILLFLVTKLLITGNIKARRELNDEEDHISGIIADNLTNFETVKFFAQEQKEESRISGRYEHWISKIWSYSLTFRWIDLTTEGLGVIGTFIIIGLSLMDVYSGRITIGDFVFITSASSSFFPRVSEFMYSLRELAKHFSDLERYFGVLDIPVAVKDPENPKKLPSNVSGKIAFEDVTFCYNDRNDVLENINLLIKAGESVALVGRSGAGKTTMTKLLMRFYDLSAGRIIIDGFDIKTLLKKDLRSLIGIVPQEPILFNDTIMFNIGYGRPEASLEEVTHAAKLSNFDDFVQTLAYGYNTTVGERGIKLSGGQKQRLAIARAILKDPRIIIFDEATSHLDSESEKLIQQALWKVSKGKTTIIIAHRLSTIMHVDRIIVFEKGRIVEQGSHQELLNRGSGLYKSLWRLQTEGELEND